jgi:hypothetical protein
MPSGKFWNLGTVITPTTASATVNPSKPAFLLSCFQVFDDFIPGNGLAAIVIVCYFRKVKKLNQSKYQSNRANFRK